MDDPVMRRLADADPVPTGPLTLAETARAQSVLYRIMARPRTAVRRSHRRRLWTRGAAAAAALATALLAGTFATTPASARYVLLEAAAGAAVQPVEDGEYWYVRSQEDDPRSVPYQREVWRSADSFLLRSESSAAFAAWEAGVSFLDPELVRVQDMSNDDGTIAGFGDGVQLTWAELESLPSDPDALSRQLTAELAVSGHGGDWDLWNQVVGMLQESPASPELRRGLWQVLSGISGVELVGTVTDSAGREATAIQADFTDRRLPRYELLLDPGDGSLLETRVYDLDDSLLFRSTVLEQGYRDAAPAPEPPLCGPGSAPEQSC
ncbi:MULTISPECIES: CU044_5270 family protein [Isoptericola]|nr:MULTISPECIES: CU044_5270 family protein [Isoptericola]